MEKPMSETPKTENKIKKDNSMVLSAYLHVSAFDNVVYLYIKTDLMSV